MFYSWKVWVLNLSSRLCVLHVIQVQELHAKVTEQSEKNMKEYQDISLLS